MFVTPSQPLAPLAVVKMSPGAPPEAALGPITVRLAPSTFSAAPLLPSARTTMAVCPFQTPPIALESFTYVWADADAKPSAIIGTEGLKVSFK